MWLPNDSFPQVTFKNSPQEVELKLVETSPLNNSQITIGAKIRLKANPDVILSIISNDCHENEFECSNGADEGLWKPAIYGFSHSNGHYVVGGACWKQCIPYKGNEHLRGTTNACNDYFKTWKE